MLFLILISPNIYPTRSPISVLSPALSIARSGRSAHAWMTRLYFFSTYLLPNRMLSLTVRFCIHASWGTYATEPWIDWFIDLLIDLLIGWLIDLLIYLLIGWSNNHLINWLFTWLFTCFVDILVNSLIDLFINYWFKLGKN